MCLKTLIKKYEYFGMMVDGREIVGCEPATCVKVVFALSRQKYNTHVYLETYNTTYIISVHHVYTECPTRIYLCRFNHVQYINMNLICMKEIF